MADAWYLFDGAGQLGPLSLVELRRLLEAEGSPVVQVWREGLAEWTAPADLPELAPVRPPPLPPAALEDQRASASTRHSRFNNFVAMNWRGEFSLATSYWLFGFLGNVLAGVVAAVVVVLLQANEGYQPTIIFASILFLWLAIAGVAIWQSVGVWRSANRHINARALLGKKSPWAGLAKIAAIIGILRLAGTFLTSGGPQLVETGRMSFLDDPDIPNYSIRVMRNGTEAEIAGGFKYGLTNDFLKILSASRQIKILHLDSPGGRIGEAISLNKVIRSRGLVTYVSSNCMSACTIAFAGGIRRILKQGAVLGFHAPTFPGMTKAELAESWSDQQQIFLAAGFDERFVTRALSTPNTTLWEPAPGDLLQARVITAISNGSDFAISGMGTSLSKSELGVQLSKTLPFMEPLKRRFPEDYETIVQAFFAGYVDGKTEAETQSAGRTALFAVLKRLRPLADDDVLADFGAVFADEYSAIGVKSAAECYQYASGVGLMATSGIPEALLARENDLDKRAIETAASRPSVDAAYLSSVWKKIGTTMINMGVKNDQLELFTATTVPSDRYGDYCAVSTMLFKEISRLPRAEAGAVMREILADK